MWHHFLGAKVWEIGWVQLTKDLMGPAERWKAIEGFYKVETSDSVYIL